MPVHVVGVKKIKINSYTCIHTILSPYEMHLSMYTVKQPLITFTVYYYTMWPLKWSAGERYTTFFIIII